MYGSCFFQSHLAESIEFLFGYLIDVTSPDIPASNSFSAFISSFRVQSVFSYLTNINTTSSHFHLTIHPVHSHLHHIVPKNISITTRTSTSNLKSLFDRGGNGENGGGTDGGVVFLSEVLDWVKGDSFWW